MENIKREELEKLVGIDKVNTFYNIMNINLEKVEKLYVLFILKIIHWDL